MSWGPSLSKSSAGISVPIFFIWWWNSLKRKRKWRQWSTELYNKITWASKSTNFIKFSKIGHTNSRHMLISLRLVSFGEDLSLLSLKLILRIRRKLSVQKYSELWANYTWATTTCHMCTIRSRSSLNPRSFIWIASVKYFPSDFIIFLIIRHSTQFYHHIYIFIN